MPNRTPPVSKNPPERYKRAEGPAVIKMQALLKAAYDSPRRIELEYATKGEAIRFRAGLYNAMRNVKAYPEDYPELYEVVTSVSVELLDNPVRLSIGRYELSSGITDLDRQLAAQGVDLSAYMKPAAKVESDSSVARVMATLGGPVTGPGQASGNTTQLTKALPDPTPPTVSPPPNPYYRRS